MTWRGCHAGTTTARGWTYCSNEGTDPLEITVHGEPALTVELGVLVCVEHAAEMIADPGAWLVDSWPDIGRGKSGRTDERPRIYRKEPRG